MQREEKGGLALGIDLGTTYSCVGVWLSQHQQVEIIKNEHGNRKMPSYVSFTEKEPLIGEVAEYEAIANPMNTIFGMFAPCIFHSLMSTRCFEHH